MGPRSFSTSQWVAYPVELVFAFFANPPNLLHLTPPGLKMRLESLQIVAPAERPQAAESACRFHSLAAGVGSEIVLSFRPLPWLPFRLHWTARIVEFAWFSHFVDEQMHGPFASFRHRHGIEPEKRKGVEGTLVSDRIEFTLRGGWPGQLLAGCVLRQLKYQFAYRQERLKAVLEAAARQARGQR